MLCYQDLWGCVFGGVGELRALHRWLEATASKPDREYIAVAHEGPIFL